MNISVAYIKSDAVQNISSVDRDWRQFKVNGENLPSSTFIGLVASLSPSWLLVSDISFLTLKLVGETGS